MTDTETIDLDAKMQELLKLTPEQRVQLAERLLASLPPPCDDPEVQREWNEEIARRVNEIDEGRVKLIPAEEVHARIESMLRKLKQSAE